jgi:hypothetical protein
MLIVKEREMKAQGTDSKGTDSVMETGRSGEVL